MMVLLARRYHFDGASSSAVEQETLNLLVVGSNPSWLTRERIPGPTLAASDLSNKRPAPIGIVLGGPANLRHPRLLAARTF